MYVHSALCSHLVLTEVCVCALWSVSGVHVDVLETNPRVGSLETHVRAGLEGTVPAPAATPELTHTQQSGV